MNWPVRVRRYCLTGLLVLVPAWGTFLIMLALLSTVDGMIADLLGPVRKPGIPGLAEVSLLGLILLTGVVATRFLGQRMLRWTEELMRRIPVVRTIYGILKGMTDLFNFKARFGRSKVVVFPFPREGLWALGFVMGAAPASLQVAPVGPLVMVFVPTAIHPFTGYLAFMPQNKIFSVNLPAEEAMKMEFSAGLYRPRPGWLTKLPGPGPGEAGPP